MKKLFKVNAIILILFAQTSLTVQAQTSSLDNEEIKKWAIEAVRETMTYNYQNYKERMQQNSSYFTKHGWAAISQALGKSGMIDMVIKDKLNLMSFQADLAEVCNKDEKENTRTWAVVVPIKTVYSTELNKWNNFQTVVVFIEETMDDEKKITKKAIDRWMSGIESGGKNPCQSYEDVKSFDKDVEAFMGVLEEIDETVESTEDTK